MDETHETEGWTVFRLPRSHWHCQLSNFEWGSVTPASLRKHINAFAAQVLAGEAPHLILTGNPGIGKSHLGVSVYRTLSAQLGTQLVTWVNIPNFCESVKRTYKDGEPDVAWPDFEGAKRLVVLDDLFGRDLSPHEVSQIVYRMIDTAYQNGAAVLVNMNQDVKELQSRLASHEISRLLAKSTIIPMTATKDYRRG